MSEKAFFYDSVKNHQYAFFYKIKLDEKEKILYKEEFEGIKIGKNNTEYFN